MTELEKVTKVSELHERLGYLGAKTAEFFAKMHSLWAEGRGSQLLQTQFVDMAAGQQDMIAVDSDVSESTVVEPATIESSDLRPAPAESHVVESAPKMTSRVLLATLRRKIAAGLPILGAESVVATSNKKELDLDDAEDKHPIRDFLANFKTQISQGLSPLLLTSVRA